MEVPSEDSAHYENHEREQGNRAPTRAAKPTAHTHAQHTHPAHSAQPAATIARYPPRASNVTSSRRPSPRHSHQGNHSCKATDEQELWQPHKNIAYTDERPRVPMGQVSEQDSHRGQEGTATWILAAGHIPQSAVRS